MSIDKKRDVFINTVSYRQGREYIYLYYSFQICKNIFARPRYKMTVAKVYREMALR